MGFATWNCAICVYSDTFPLEPKTEILNPETLKPKMSGGVAAFQGLCGHDRRQRPEAPCGSALEGSIRV